MTLLEGYDFYKKVQNTKYDKNNLETKRKLQDFRNQLGIFTDKIFKDLNGFIDVSNGKGMWQNSGNFSKYIWNRYKPSNDNSNLVIYFKASTILNEGLFISIGLIDDKVSEFENNNIDEIYEFLENECKKINCEGFERKDVGWGERLFSVQNIDLFESINYNNIISELKKVYIKTLNKFYNLKTEKKNYKDLYIKWMQENSQNKTSNKLNSYLKSIEMLSTILSYDIFEVDNKEELHELYKDLVKEQRNKNSKYYNESTHSYGQNGFYSASIKSYINFLNKFDKESTKLNSQRRSLNLKLNTILYGPPGTGKTYYTINKAIEIIENRKLTDEESKDRTKLKEKFELYKEIEQIEFITFHQSYGYEEFVEGIKALPVGSNGNEDGDEMIYDVIPGVLKKLAQKAKDSMLIPSINKVKKYKLNAPQLNIQAEMIQDDENSFRLLAGSKIRKGESNSFRLHALKEKVVTTAKNKEEDEWYVIEEDYTFKSMSGSSSIVLGRASNGFNEWKEIKEELSETLHNHISRNYILIIDEINRGNISKIFGELITLIEDSKRYGNDEFIEITLPYSGEKFSVPNNLYILGTMNTADRSIALMDTALRRRFHFEEMMPKLDLLDFEVEGINIKIIVNTINQRIEYLYDRDHMIGHAYFIGLKDNQSIKELDNIFKNKVIPLLQEYFYDDWEKIQMVLGDHREQKAEDKNKFIVSKEQKGKELFGFDHEDDQIIFTVNESFSIDAYKKIKL